MSKKTQGAVTDADRAYVRELFPEVAQISDEKLAAEVVNIWAEVWKESPWERIEDVPKNPETVKLKFGLVAHTRSVTLQAIAVAQAAQQFYGISANMDLLIAGALLHDVSKMLEYGPKPDGGAGKTQHGKLIQHGIYGAVKSFEHGLPTELNHMIVSHTAQSAHHPKTLECIILHYVDYADTDVLAWENGSKLQLDRH